jgi:peptidoglycan/LPS O-acetylase OafA/YrhL
MIDDDDVSNYAAFGGPGPGAGWPAWVLFLAMVLALAYCAHQNNEDCARKSCPAGTVPKVASHECLCVTRAR